MSVPGGSPRDPLPKSSPAWLTSRSPQATTRLLPSPTRRAAKLMGQFLPARLCHIGWSVMHANDNMFGGGNYDSDDLDEC